MPGAPDPAETVPVDPAGVTIRAENAQASSRDLETLGRYPVTGVLGAGGMGDVLQVKDAQLGREVAAKVIRGRVGQQQLDKFVLEAQVTGQLEHPGIIPLYELGWTEDRQPYFTMKRVAGDDLQRLIERLATSPDDAENPLRRLADRLQVFLKVCDAIRFAHSRHVIHRDLKPANLMVGPFGEVLVMDWGLAKLVGQDDELLASAVPASDGDRSSPLQTLAGTVMGTPAYMPPEQARGEIDRIDERSDVYALGAILYEMLALVPPYSGPSSWAVLEQVLAGPPLRPSEQVGAPDVPFELEAIARRAMRHERDERYPSVDALKQDVEAFLEQRLVGAASYSRLQALRKWVRRHPYLVRGALAVLLACGAVIGAIEVQHRQRVSRAAAQVAKHQPDALLERAAQHVEGIPADPVERRSPSPDQKERYGKTLRRLQKLAQAYRRWGLLAPTDRRSRDGLARTYLALARLAEVSEDFSLAEFALSQAIGISPDRDEVTRRLAAVGVARRAVLIRHREEIERALASVTGEELTRHGSAHRAALARILRYSGEPQTSRILRGRLTRLTAQIGDAMVGVLLDVNEIEEQERKAGWTKLSGLEAAARAWIRESVPDYPGRPAVIPPEEAQRAMLRTAMERLIARLARPPGVRASRSLLPPLFAKAQQRALAQDGPELELVCEALGLLGPSPANAAALIEYLSVEYDSLRAVTAGVALARLTPQLEFASRALDAFADVTAEQLHQKRFGGTRGHWWARVSRELRRVSSPGTKAIRAGTADVDALERRALALSARGEREGAERLLTQAIALAPQLARLYLARGQVSDRAGNSKRAMADFSRAIARDDSDARAWTSRSLLHRRLGDMQAALRDAKRAVELGPTRASAWAARGAARGELDDLDGAMQDFSKALNLDPTDARFWRARSVVRRKKADLKGALEDLRRALQLDPRDPAAWAARGNCHLVALNHDAALADYAKAIELDPRCVDGWDGRGSALQRKGDYVGAIAAHSKALEIAPDATFILNNRGLANQRARRFPAALRDFRRLTELDPSTPDGWAGCAEVRSLMGDHRGAIADFGRALQVAPPARRASLWRGFGKAQKALGDLKGARSSFDKAVELAPRSVYSLNDRALLLRALGERKAALRDLDRAIEIAPRNAVFRANRGMIRSDQKDYAGAASDYSRAIEIDPGMVEAWYGRSVCKVAIRDHRGALADVSKAIELRPRYALAWSHRGMLKRRMGDLAGAAKDLSFGLELAPRDAMTWYRRGQVRNNLGDLKGANADYTKAVEIGPPNMAYFNNRGDVRRRLGLHALAIEDFDEVIRLAPRAWQPWFGRGMSRLALGKKAEGLRDLAAAYERCPVPSVRRTIVANVEKHGGTAPK